MRWVLLVVAVLAVAAGAALGFAYPKWAERGPGREIARWTAYEKGGDFAAGEAVLQAQDGSTVLTMDTRSAAPLPAGAPRALVLLRIEDEAGTELSRVVIGPPRGGGLESPQTGIMRYSGRVATLDPASGLHRFLAERGKDFDDGLVLGIDFALHAASRPASPYAQPAGYALIALGALAMLLALRRRPENPNSSPPRPGPPRHWGRQ